MNFYSQAGQDKFVYELLVKTGIAPKGTFLDIGAGGRSISNTLGLEEIGWTGWLIDNSPEAQKDSEGRNAKFILADATTLDYSFLPDRVDYLSLDVDSASLSALERLFETSKCRFKVCTLEHDAYRFGDSLRAGQRKAMKAYGYYLVRPNVSNPDPFEDWWVPMQREYKFNGGTILI